METSESTAAPTASKSIPFSGIPRWAGAVFGLYMAGVLLGHAAANRVGDGHGSLPRRLRAERLRAFGRFPLRPVGRALVADDLPRTAALMTAVNLNGALLHFIAGTVYLAPPLALVQGLLLGALLAPIRSARAYLLTLAVLPFEVGAFALSASLGMRVASRWLLARRCLRRSLVQSWPELRWGLPLVLLLQTVGGTLEAAGAIWLRLPGALTREEIARAVMADPDDTPAHR